MKRFVAVAWLGAVAITALPTALGHEIPADVAVRIIVKPEGDRLRLLVRAPLESMQDVEFPTFGPGYLDVARADRSLRHAALVWLANDIEMYEDGRRLPHLELVAVQASIPSDRSFAAFDTALAHTLGPPLPQGTQLVWSQALIDALFEAPIESDRSRFAIRPRLERLGLRVVSTVRFVTPDGNERVFRLDGDPGKVELDPRWHQALLRFAAQGFRHILDGIDHLLFLLCLVVPFRRDWRALVWIVTAFTAGHSATLIAAGLGAAPQALWFPPLIETLIAASIVYMALENVVFVWRTAGASGGGVPASAVDRLLRARWAVAAAFGLVHGFGFSFALRETMQFAGDHALTSLLSFNVGVELGQLAVLLALVPLLNLTFRCAVPDTVGAIILSAIVGHTAWHWMAERFAALRAFW